MNNYYWPNCHIQSRTQGQNWILKIILVIPHIINLLLWVKPVLHCFIMKQTSHGHTHTLHRDRIWVCLKPHWLNIISLVKMSRSMFQTVSLKNLSPGLKWNESGFPNKSSQIISNEQNGYVSGTALTDQCLQLMMIYWASQAKSLEA